MIEIAERELCCGCGACVQICPKQCIHMQEDAEGFLYPKVDATICIECGLCEKVCPEKGESFARIPQKVCAAQNKDEYIRKESSSGGVFTFLAEQVLATGGVVFGARFNDKWEVVHDYVEEIEGLRAFRGSKYVQSVIGDNFKKVESFLKNRRKVLFSGTPCQVAGLKRYLRKEYDNLLTVDFVCHGVPSPKVWRMYLKEEIEKIARQGDDGKNTVSPSPKVLPVLTGVSFRDKSEGWKKYSFALHLTKASAEGEKNSVLHSDRFYENYYMRAFLADLTLRPSCYACPAKTGRSGSDITIGDFWGIEQIMPEIDDDKGLSLVFIHNTEKANLGDSINKVEIAYADAIKYNSSAEKSVNMPIYRELFFKNLLKHKNFYYALDICQSAKFIQRVRRVLYKKLGI